MNVNYEKEDELLNETAGTSQKAYSNVVPERKFRPALNCFLECFEESASSVKPFIKKKIRVS